MPIADDEDDQPVILSLRDYTPITHSVFSERAKFTALESLANTAWIIQRGDEFEQESGNPLADGFVEFGEFFCRNWQKLNP